MKSLTYFAIVCTLCASIVYAHTQKKGTQANGMPQGIEVDFKAVGENVQIEINTKSNSWAGLVLGSNLMVSADGPSDMIIFVNKGDESECFDLSTNPYYSYS